MSRDYWTVSLTCIIQLWFVGQTYLPFYSKLQMRQRKLWLDCRIKYFVKEALQSSCYEIVLHVLCVVRGKKCSSMGS